MMFKTRTGRGRVSRQLVAGTAVLLAFAGLGASGSSGSLVVVPDDLPSVQTAIDSGADTVLVREGTYPERPLLNRPLVLQGVALSKRPQLDGLDITNQDFEYFPSPWVVTVSGVNFVGRVDYSTVAGRPRGLQFAFSACSLGAGFYQTQSLDPYDIGTLTIRNCYLGGVSAARVDRVIMHADTIRSGPTGGSRVGTFAIELPPAGAVNWKLSGASIRNCIFRGGGLTLTGNPYATIALNRMEDCAGGITVLDAADAKIDSNVVIGCRTGILVSGQNVDVGDNNLSRCGIGIYSGADGRITGNRIMGSGNQGILSESSAFVLVDGNVVVGGGRRPAHNDRVRPSRDSSCVHYGCNCTEQHGCRRPWIRYSTRPCLYEGEWRCWEQHRFRKPGLGALDRRSVWSREEM